MDKVYGIMWATRTTQETQWRELFSLVNRIEAIILFEIQEPTLHSNISQDDNNDIHREDLLIVKEKKITF